MPTYIHKCSLAKVLGIAWLVLIRRWRLFALVRGILSFQCRFNAFTPVDYSGYEYDVTPHALDRFTAEVVCQLPNPFDELDGEFLGHCLVAYFSTYSRQIKLKFASYDLADAPEPSDA